MHQNKMHYIILYNSLYKIKDFSITKIKAILVLIKSMNKKKVYI